MEKNKNQELLKLRWMVRMLKRRNAQLEKEKMGGMDRLFAILRANLLLVNLTRRYHTTNSHHPFGKHKNLVKNMAASRPEE